MNKTAHQVAMHPSQLPPLDGDVCADQITGLPADCRTDVGAVDPCAPGSPYVASYVCQFRPDVYWREHPCQPGSPYATSYICQFQVPAVATPPAPVQSCLDIGFWFAILVTLCW